MESLSSLLGSKSPSEPPQISALKRYAQEVHSIEISVLSSTRNYLIRVPNGAIAHKFRVDTANIITTCNLDKPLVIHIG